MNKQAIINHLRWLADGGKPEYTTGGICLELKRKLGVKYEELFPYFKSWEHYSGNIVYPVPATNKKYSVIEQFDYTQNLWIREQGKLRRDLCRHIANEMEKEL